jgi:hypothetical protein
MMEEWHQKLHNNTSPDDVAICEALLAMLGAGCDPAAYWAHLRVPHPCLLPPASLRLRRARRRGALPVTPRLSDQDRLGGPVGDSSCSQSVRSE